MGTIQIIANYKDWLTKIDKECSMCKCIEWSYSTEGKIKICNHCWNMEVL